MMSAEFTLEDELRIERALEYARTEHEKVSQAGSNACSSA